MDYFGMDEGEFEDFLADAINDSLDMDWTSRVGAKAIIREIAALRQPAPSREAIARIIDPGAFNQIIYGGPYAAEQGRIQNMALAKADAILALGGEQWRTIDSAPRDGTRVLASWDPKRFGPPESRHEDDPAIVRWCAEHWKGPGWYPDAMGTPYHVTHWMPLPAPPEATHDR